MCQLGMSNEELMKFLTQETNKPEFTNKLTDYYTKVKSTIPDKALAVLPVCTLLAATLASKAIAENNKIISQQLAALLNEKQHIAVPSMITLTFFTSLLLAHNANLQINL